MYEGINYTNNKANEKFLRLKLNPGLFVDVKKYKSPNSSI